MKKIIFKSLSLLNFKGIRNLHVSFGENLTVISGRNAAGKTSIADAIMWVLFDVGYDGNKLEPKTYNKEHQIIPEIPHEATLVLKCNDEEYTLKRSLSDAWKGDKCTNTYKYYVNGDVTTAGDFKKVVEGICPDSVFRRISSATNFCSLPWQKQRELLESLAEQYTTQDITQGDERFDFVVEELKKKSIADLIHHIKYKRKEVQKQLDAVPVRLAELNKSLPEAQDWDALSAGIENLQEKLGEIDQKTRTIRIGGADKVRYDGILKKIEFAEKRKRNMEQGAMNLATEQATKHQSDVITSNIAVKKAQSLVDDLKATMRGYTESEIHAKDKKEECESKVVDINNRLDELSKSRWSWNAEDGICPHCGQPLPAEDVERIKKESKDRFNERKSNASKKIQEEFNGIQQEYTDAKNILEKLDNDRMVTTNQLVKANKTLKEAEFKKQEVDAEKPKTYEQILAEKEEYQQVVKEIADLQAELNEPSANSDENAKILFELEKEREPIGTRYNEVLKLLVNKEAYDRISELIEKAKQDKESYQNQLDELDEKLDLANEYNKKSCQLLEENVNGHFSYVKWSMFTQDLDGNMKPYCECYHDGVPYSRLNGAAKVNAGIDIANTFSRFYEVSAPMVLDECESVNDPIYSGDQQQIRLKVTTDDKLKFEYPDPALI